MEYRRRERSEFRWYEIPLTLAPPLPMSPSEGEVLILTGEPATELARMENLLQTITAGYRNAVRSTAQYAIEMDSLDAQLFRQHIDALEDQLATAAAPEHWEALEASFRSELRAYRDKATGQLGRMRAEIKAAADAMLIFADSVACNGLDHEQQLQEELGQLNRPSRTKISARSAP